MKITTVGVRNADAACVMLVSGVKTKSARRHERERVANARRRRRPTAPERAAIVCARPSSFGAAMTRTTAVGSRSRTCSITAA